MSISCSHNLRMIRMNKKAISKNAMSATIMGNRINTIRIDRKYHKYRYSGNGHTSQPGIRISIIMRLTIATWMNIIDARMNAIAMRVTAYWICIRANGCQRLRGMACAMTIVPVTMRSRRKRIARATKQHHRWACRCGRKWIRSIFTHMLTIHGFASSFVWLITC